MTPQLDVVKPLTLARTKAPSKEAETADSADGALGYRLAYASEGPARAQRTTVAQQEIRPLPDGPQQQDDRGKSTCAPASVLARIRREASAEAEKGRWFRASVHGYGARHAEFDVADVWRWRDWPERERLTGLDGRDHGIAPVAQQKDGTVAATQCKCYAEDAVIGKQAIDSFLNARPPGPRRGCAGWSPPAGIPRLNVPSTAGAATLTLTGRDRLSRPCKGPMDEFQAEKLRSARKRTRP